MKMNETEGIFSIEYYWYMLKSKIHYVLVCMFLGIGFAAVYTFFIATPKYETTVQMIVQTNNDDANKVALNDLNANILLVNTYKDMIKSNKLLSQTQLALKDKGIRLTAKEMSGMISIQQSQNSQMFELKVVSDRPQLSQEVGETISKIFQKEVEDYSSAEKVKIVSPATVSDYPVSPKNNLNLLVGLILGLSVGLGSIFLGDIINNTIKSDEFITVEAGVPILGVITDVPEKILKEGKEVDLVYYRENPRRFKRDFYSRKKVHRKRRKRRRQELKI